MNKIEDRAPTRRSGLENRIAARELEIAQARMNLATRISSRRGDAQKSRKAGGATTNAGGAGKWRSEYTEAED